MTRVKNFFFAILVVAAGYGIWNAWPTIQDTFITVPRQTTLEMTWHRWEQDGVTLMATDQNQGEKLVPHLADIAAKWRPAEAPDMPIKLMVVNNEETMLQLFGFDKSRTEIRNGQLYIWFLCKDDASLGL